MTPSETRKRHFERLNSYRHFAEYAEYAKAIGAKVPQGDLPCLIGDRWEINEAPPAPQPICTIITSPVKRCLVSVEP